MSETHAPSELEALMDDLDVMVEAIDVAKGRLQAARRNRVPREAPARPDALTPRREDAQARAAADQAAAQQASAEETGAEQQQAADQAQEVAATQRAAAAERESAADADAHTDEEQPEAAQRDREELRVPLTGAAAQPPEAVPAGTAEPEAAEPSAQRVEPEQADPSDQRAEQVQRFGGRLDGDEIVVPAADRDVPVKMAAWRALDAQQLDQAARGETTPATEVLAGQVDQEGAVPVQGQALPERIVATDDGQLRREEGVDRTDLRSTQKAVLAEATGAKFTPRDGMLWVQREETAAPGQPSAAAERISAVTAGEIAAMSAASVAGGLDLAEKHRPDGSLAAQVWVDGNQVPTTHPDGVPSVWYDQDGAPEAFGHYEDGQPAGQWGWGDPESGAYASDRAVMDGGQPRPGSTEHRDGLDEPWQGVDETPGADEKASGTSPALSAPSARRAGPSSSTSEPFAGAPQPQPQGTTHLPTGPRPR